jgi:hypothetical protein
LFKDTLAKGNRVPLVEQLIDRLDARRRRVELGGRPG